ncbi:uroporphyrinogen-III synthase [Paenibacillus sp. P96]|uniref:Uroporphyrinogen-III synthase n=1 Tax=Paenibacillus zeirhizosphaerae TaxID=2987519 RepID=A0ABT9FN76_9BACL|nr:uroporphyrinogen-III synthase [Paenibacillus sp. P96]MDP4096165.1 uroporphyrinogen-III synthase [Paenibacillus sp. P96]
MALRMAGKTVALAGPRKSEEMKLLVEKMGGTALLRPAQGTVFLDDAELRAGIESWLASPPDWTLLTTGMGLDALYNMADEMGATERLQELLAASQLAARGYKTVNALKKRGLIPVVRDDDGSTTGLIRAFAPYNLKDKQVILQLHGDPAPRLVEWLQEQGAHVRQVLPYKHIPPETKDLEDLVQDILQRQVDAVAFTSGPQIRFLAEYAHSRGVMDEVLTAFRDDIVAVSVGKVTAQAMLEEGIDRIVVPAEERMGSMMVELGRYFESGIANGYGLGNE